MLHGIICRKKLSNLNKNRCAIDGRIIALNTCRKRRCISHSGVLWIGRKSEGKVLFELSY